MSGSYEQFLTQPFPLESKYLYKLPVSHLVHILELVQATQVVIFPPPCEHNKHFLSLILEASLQTFVAIFIYLK